MEARIGSESHPFYGVGASNLNGMGKKNFEWDLNDWKWDGELFIASPLNSVPSDCRNKQLFPDSANGMLSNSSSSCSDETDFGVASKGKGEAEKRRKIAAVEEDGLYDGSGSLALKLGGHAYPIMEADHANWEGKNGKKSKLQGGNSSRPTCQVEGCGADLSNSKDYHRRHKVCEVHAKASTAVVGNAIQRFCQQCSRFHLLQEFDEGKRSCRRRLAGHNRRRRKTHPDVTANGTSMIDDRASSYILISLLRILSNLHSDGSGQSKDQDLLSHLLRNLSNLAGSFDARNLSGLPHTSQDPQKLGTTAGTSSDAANNLVPNGAPALESARPLTSASKITYTNGTQGSPLKPTNHMGPVAATTMEMHSKMMASPESMAKRVRLKDFDLNSTYNEECRDGCEKSAIPVHMGTGSPNCPSWLLQDSQRSSPPQTSGNSDSTSAHSLSSSNGDAQCRTDRIILKLFGKDPNDLPLVLRAQILDWLSHSPTDIESYIRPGCIILTIYLRLAESAWEELCHDLSSNLNRLFHNSSDNFWRTGWIYARVQHHVAFIYNGQVVLDTPLLLRCPNNCKILCVTPIAVSSSARVNFTVKGFNLIQSTCRLLCSFEGKYLVQETTQALVEGTGTGARHEGSQHLSFSCSLPNAAGRGFIEVEDHGLSNCFLPFIVAEEDVCSEIRMLENAIDVTACKDHDQGRTDAKNARIEALDFLNEFGWLLRRNHLRSRSEQIKYCPNVFHLKRFRQLMAFAMDREWCAVVKKLLDILFNGTVDVGGRSPVELALSENLLHTAVRKNCKAMVELLLRYIPDKMSKETSYDRFLFRPDIVGPSNITPLHIAAASSGADDILDALTDDPQLIGIKAWKNAHDSTGFTPEDYAHARGHKSYVEMVQEKIDKQPGKGHAVVDIPGKPPAPDSHKLSDGPNFGKLSGFEMSMNKVGPAQQIYCNRCSQQLVYRSSAARTLLYRPAMLSMVGIAAVCVCVGLLLKGPPEVFYVFPQFRWELLGYGTM
ncbi:squamosa promoter-binding-like protein 6 [Phoenix dactylifera]|uniref:Squamosa promoter-binding-like protein 6 n=1 Tax=Phoenix dactylifera TaxID=42345 RepID=A0A8B7CZZ8_PHODC|nr:squamosa promoter-binding-like protein 6 [Phoenix dactylifera]